jgi:hypothetical protein
MYVINPDLTKINLSFTPVTVVPVSDDIKNLAARVLATTTISKNSTGNCKDANGVEVTPISNLNELKAGKQMTACNATCQKSSTPCTKMVSPPSLKMFNVMLELASEGKSFTITSIAGGEHAVNSGHYNGTTVDISITPKTEYPALLTAFEVKGAYKDQTFCDNAGKIIADCGSETTHLNVDFR